MPLLRYFVFVGGALLALVLIVNAALPALPAAENSQTAASDLSIIRIHSDRKWPERIVLDTTHPAVVASQTPAAAEIAQAPQKSAAVEPPKPQVREAFAQLRPNPNEIRKAEPRRKHKAVARVYVGPPQPIYGAQRPFRVAQQPRFGFFGGNIW